MKILIDAKDSTSYEKRVKQTKRNFCNELTKKMAAHFSQKQTKQ